MDEQRQENQLESRYNLEDLPGAMDDSEGWQERVMDIRAEA